jgi:hypothetical protein
VGPSAGLDFLEKGKVLLLLLYKKVTYRHTVVGNGTEVAMEEETYICGYCKKSL